MPAPDTGSFGTARRWLDEFLSDSRYGVRQLATVPTFTLTAVLTLALAIGACSSIFSVVNAVLIRRLPYKHPDRLALVWGTHGSSSNREPVSHSDLQDWRTGSRSFEELAAFRASVYTLTDADHSERVRDLQVGDGYFRVMDSNPFLGRFFAPSDHAPGAERVAVLSYAFWQQEFSGDPAALGRMILLNLQPYLIVGVAPSDLASLPNSVIFRPPSQLYTPIVEQYGEADRAQRSRRAIGRLKDDVAASQAQADLDVLAAAMRERHPEEDEGRGVRVVSIKDDLVRNVRSSLLLMQAAVLLVLLIACGNVANLLLGRSSVRHREFTIRLAIGAAPVRLVRQVLTESALVAALGGAAGVLLASWSVRVLTRLGTSVLPQLADVSIDMPVLLFTAAVCVACGLVFGAAPALEVSRVDLVTALGSGGRGLAASRRQSWTRSLLVGSEVALSVVLLIAAGLLLKSFAQLQRVDLGFDPDHVGMTFVYPPRLQQASIEQQQRFFTDVLTRVSAIRGIETAGITSSVPDSGDFDSVGVAPRGRVFAPGLRPTVDRLVVSAGYFRTLAIPLLQGRLLNEADDFAHPLVIVVNQQLAADLFPGRDPIGQQLQMPATNDSLDETAPFRTIVGVVGDVVQNGVASEKTSQVYVPYSQYACPTSNLLFRTSGEPLQLSASLRAALRDLDPSLIVPEFAAMPDVVAGSIADRRFSTTLMAMFGFSGLLLAAIGVYGVISYGIAQRVREFGTRIALGATPRQIATLVVWQGMRPVLVGAAIGVVVAIEGSRAVERLLYNTSALDAVTFATVIFVLCASALLACGIPAHRATRVDPVEALRAD